NHQRRERHRWNELLLQRRHRQPAKDRHHHRDQGNESPVTKTENCEEMHGAPWGRWCLSSVFHRDREPRDRVRGLTDAAPAAPRILKAAMSPHLTTIRRIVQLMIGLFLFGIGIALMVRSELGVAPWDV